MSIVNIIRDYHQALLSGLWVTVQLCLFIWSFGIVVGTLLGIASAKWKIAVGLPLRGLMILITSVPVLIFLLWCHFPLQTLLQVNVDPFWTSAWVLGLLNAMVVFEIVRSALLRFPRDYITVAKVYGIPRIKVFTAIVGPLLLRKTLPGLLAAQVASLQATLFASLISVEELFRVAQRINSNLYDPVQVYSALGVFYLMICLPLNALAWWMEWRWRHNLSE